MKLTNRGGVWYVDFKMTDGRRRRISTNETDRAAAEKVAPGVVARAIQTAGKPQASLGVAPSLGELLERCFERKWQHNKRADYARLMVNRLRREVGFWLSDEVTKDKLEDYCNGLLKAGKRPATVNRRMSCIGTALREAHESGLIAAVPKVPRYAERNRKERYLTAAEEAEVMEFLKGKAMAEAYTPGSDGAWAYMRALVPFLIDTGCRLSEALGAEAYGDGSAVHLKAGETKSDAPRLVPLTTRARAALKVMLASPHHRKVSVDWVGWRWLLVRRAIPGLGKVNIHILRHTCASRLVQRGVHLQTVSRWLGHSSVTVTERYAHLAPDQMSNALAAMEGAPVEVRHARHTGSPLEEVIPGALAQSK